MAVSHSFTGEDIEDGGGEKADTQHDHHSIKHGGNPRVYPFSGVPHGPEPESGLASLLLSAPLGIKIREALVFTSISKL